MFTSTFSAVIALALVVLFWGPIKVLTNSIIGSLLPLARSLEIYSKSVEKRTELTVKRDIGKLEAEVETDLAKINLERSKVNLPPVEGLAKEEQEYFGQE